LVTSPAPTLKGVILCADDFAIHASASEGIAELAALGRLSATSAMVLSPRWPEDVALLRPLRGQLDVGLHLDWTSDFAVSAGHGLSLGTAMFKALTTGFDAAAARTVIERQLDAFEAHWQAPPDFVDGHQHVQQFDGIRQALVQALSRRYGSASVQPYLRVSRPAPQLADLKSRIIAAMGAGAIEKIASKARIHCSKALLGIYDFSGPPSRYAQLMSDWLQGAPAGSLVMCHPAQRAEMGDAIGTARAQEFAYLASNEFSVALVQAGVYLVRGADSLRTPTNFQ
jgi:predicted glycoside hydrolase/deacetylase ChbG (UPF0249 family)